MKQLQKLLLSLLLATCPPAEAGYSRNRMEGGGEAKRHAPHPTPYVARVQGEDNHVCGGFLVAPNWVVTAAQCYEHKPLTVILGAHTTPRREESWRTFEVQDYHCPKDYESPKKGNDILLLKLKGNATSNNSVRTICFDRSKKVLSKTECRIADWSQQATVTIRTRRECLNLNPGLAENLICGDSKSAGVPEKGDAGDPLVCNNKAYGIFSYKLNSWTSVYTYIAPYLPWVDKVMKSA
ncbi:PREDICTED: granzyme E-like [Pterocles gutturalis]|uniref:granzyme E-like n=1 Tax=Pterocles gutturalis TaxID=240206 RepID=UPI0005284B36|nr:PREDICTED: granzyme E-like [Pterocles gutturalis]